MSRPRVLVGITTYKDKDYIFHHCMQKVYALDYSNFDVVIVDNTKDLNYFFTLKRRYKNVFHTERGANSREALTKSQNKIRQIFLEGGYDYLLLVESDLLIPADSIRRLMSYGKPVVGSIYFIGTGNIQVPCVFLDDVEKVGFKATRPLGIKPTEDGKKLYDKKEVDDFLNKGLQQAHGVGFGCTLIIRNIVERFPFWCDERLNDKHSDVYFYLDMQRAGIPVFVDTDITIPHFPSKWEEVKDR
jgi:GT2 family glycosyltransferase